MEMMNEGKTKHAFPTALRIRRLQVGIAIVAVVVTASIAYCYLTHLWYGKCINFYLASIFIIT